MLGIGHHDLAVSSPDVGRERLAPARRVDSTEHVTTDTGSCHLVQELGGGSQQYTDMHRRFGSISASSAPGPGDASRTCSRHVQHSSPYFTAAVFQDARSASSCWMV